MKIPSGSSVSPSDTQSSDVQLGVMPSVASTSPAAASGKLPTGQMVTVQPKKGACDDFCDCLDVICCTRDIDPPPCCPPTLASVAYAVGFNSSCCQKVICVFTAGMLTLFGLYAAQGKMW